MQEIDKNIFTTQLVDIIIPGSSFSKSAKNDEKAGVVEIGNEGQKTSDTDIKEDLQKKNSEEDVNEMIEKMDEMEFND